MDYSTTMQCTKVMEELLTVKQIQIIVDGGKTAPETPPKLQETITFLEKKTFCFLFVEFNWQCHSKV